MPPLISTFAPQVVHRVGRHFGFQAFNMDPRSEVREGIPVLGPPDAVLLLLITMF